MNNFTEVLLYPSASVVWPEDHTYTWNSPIPRFSPSDLVTDDSGDLANSASELWLNPEVVIGFSPANGPLPLSAIEFAVRRTAFLMLKA